MERTDITAISPRKRIEVLDIIRGVALFGILIVHMPMFRMDFFSLLSEFPGLSGLVEVPVPFWDRVASWMTLSLASGRFLPMFAILFGLGCYMIMERLEQKGLPARRLLWRRLWILMGFGILHYVFIWEVDILFSFAITGVVLLLFMRMNMVSLRKWIIGLSIGLSIIVVLASGIIGAILFPLIEEIELHIPAIENFMDAYMETVLQTSYWGYVGTRAIGMLVMLFVIPWVIPIYLTLFLVGLYAGKAGIVESLTRGEEPFRRALFPALISAVLGLSVSVWISFATYNPLAWAIGAIFGLIGWIGCVLFYISAIVILARSTHFGILLRPFIPVGQMPLTTYLMQSVICTWIFYGYGLGLAGQLGAGAGVLLAIAIFAFQMIFSWLWFKWFAFGPTEWLWRRLMYGKGVPFRRFSPSDAGRVAGG